MRVQLLDQGKNALALAIASGSKLRVTEYRVGRSANFPPSKDGTTVTPNTVFTGDSTMINTGVVNSDQIRYIITIPESYGPFDVGNIMLFLDDGAGGKVPFLWGVNAAPIPKYQNDPPRSIGNRCVFTLTAKYTNITEAVNLIVTAPEYSSLISYPNEEGLAPASMAGFNQAILHNHTRLGRPTIAMRRAVDSVWFLASLTQRIDDPHFGAIDGGEIGDGYLPFQGEYSAGGFYRTPNVSYNEYLEGGDDWAPDLQEGLPTDGGTYAAA